MRMIVQAATLIADRWPSSDKANDALMILGRMLSAQKTPAEAAVYFGRIPETDSKFAEAQLAAGQAYWSAYAGSSRRVVKPPEKLADWLKSAQDHLHTGIENMSQTIPPQDSAPGELIAAKMQKALEICRTELMGTIAVSKNIHEEWYLKFNALYEVVLTDMGKMVEDLPRNLQQ